MGQSLRIGQSGLCRQSRSERETNRSLPFFGESQTPREHSRWCNWMHISNTASYATLTCISRRLLASHPCRSNMKEFCRIIIVKRRCAIRSGRWRPLGANDQPTWNCANPGGHRKNIRAKLSELFTNVAFFRAFFLGRAKSGSRRLKGGSTQLMEKSDLMPCGPNRRPHGLIRGGPH